LMVFAGSSPSDPRLRGALPKDDIAPLIGAAGPWVE